MYTVLNANVRSVFRKARVKSGVRREVRKTKR
jgi:hypothetical protein